MKRVLILLSILSFFSCGAMADEIRMSVTNANFSGGKRFGQKGMYLAVDGTIAVGILCGDLINKFSSTLSLGPARYPLNMDVNKCNEIVSTAISKIQSGEADSISIKLSKENGERNAAIEAVKSDI